ncbi:CDGP domain-containing protein [Mycolicibacterium diernhoferi]|uniref:CDGP domain-containing protein n=1 Tax=Mycolicibacterium diernhoferi TaxID=1801 RepID=A0A1T3WJS3_9MYCO|nr:hypothetical protein [Mycolicibacterium diernhoferi]OPE54557.1 hypothetical protein BV510_09695 [Mycolicibacterium diernhoferi]QYL25856.1 hypothetical protein K0O62_02525 [Mycolicibacterium diernhoferi]
MRATTAAAVGAVVAAMAFAGWVTAPTAHADACGNFEVWGNGGGQCDGPFYEDGSFQRCTTVYVLGIGGTQCFIVPAPPR